MVFIVGRVAGGGMGKEPAMEGEGQRSPIQRMNSLNRVMGKVGSSVCDGLFLRGGWTLVSQKGGVVQF